jgi:hypothetical protein
VLDQLCGRLMTTTCYSRPYIYLLVQVISLLKRAMQPAITNISLDWDVPPGIIPVSIPTELPNIISAGERLTLFAVLQNVDKNVSLCQGEFC